MKPIKFTIEKSAKGLMRAGTLQTLHGNIETPAFVVVGTKGTVKALTPEQLKDIDVQIVLANTYHLYLDPGEKVINETGGLAKFMNWEGPTMTDSGGFQVFSLGAAYGKGISKVVTETNPNKLLPEKREDENVGKLAEIGEDGVSFKSAYDGSLHYFTPEKSIQIQHDIGADLIVAFDECTSPIESDLYQSEALDRTHRWAKRSLDYHLSQENKNRQGLLGVIQGGRNEELRKKSAKYISSLDFDGFAIGGSFAKVDMSSAVKWVNEELPEDRPRHLLGIGEPEDLFMGIENGVDLFDCVAPTRNARNGTLYTHSGKINITNSEFRSDLGPIDSECNCPVCTQESVNLIGSHPYTRAYISHLYRQKEILSSTLGSIHNLYFIINLVKRIRQSIVEGNSSEFKSIFLEIYLSTVSH